MEKGACLLTATPLLLGVGSLNQDARGQVVSTRPDGCVDLTDFRTPAATTLPPRKLMAKGFFVRAAEDSQRFPVGGNERLLLLNESAAPVVTHKVHDTVFLPAQSHGKELVASTSRGDVLRFDPELHCVAEYLSTWQSCGVSPLPSRYFFARRSRAR